MFLEKTVEYVQRVSNLDEKGFKELLNTEEDTRMQSIVQYWRKQGLEQGYQEGMQKGMQEGMQ